MLTNSESPIKTPNMKVFKLLEEIKSIDSFLNSDSQITEKYKEKLKARRENLKKAISWTPEGPTIVATDEEMKSLRQEILG